MAIPSRHVLDPWHSRRICPETFKTPLTHECHHSFRFPPERAVKTKWKRVWLLQVLYDPTNTGLWSFTKLLKQIQAGALAEMTWAIIFLCLCKTHSKQAHIRNPSLSWAPILCLSLPQTSVEPSRYSTHFLRCSHLWHWTLLSLGAIFLEK